MAKCDYCGAEIEGLPFKCKYCGGVFCVWHHLPEEHDCRGLHKAQSPDAIERLAVAPITTSSVKRHSSHFSLDDSEIRDLVIAVGAVALAAMPSYSLYGLLYGLLIALLAYLPHEFAHKMASEWLGYPARYVLWPIGLFITLLSALPFMPIGFIVPGYVLIASSAIPRKDELLISSVGPLTNIAVAALALTLFPLLSIVRRLAYFSTIVAIFNLLPFGSLDGNKIMKSNVAVWVLLFVSALALLVLAL